MKIKAVWRVRSGSKPVFGIKVSMTPSEKRWNYAGAGLLLLGAAYTGTVGGINDFMNKNNCGALSISFKDAQYRVACHSIAVSDLTDNPEYVNAGWYLRERFKMRQNSALRLFSN